MHSTTGRERGFTLVELIVVLVIIAAVSGFVIPSVAALGRSTDMAASAKTQQDLANNLQQFFVLQKRFPQGMDSLLVDATLVRALLFPALLGLLGERAWWAPRWLGGGADPATISG